MTKNSSNNKIKTASGAQDLKKASELLKDAEKYVKSAKANINAINVKSISAPGMAAAGIMANIKESLLGILSQESSLLANLSNDISSNAKKLAKWDDSDNSLKSSSGDSKSVKSNSTATLKSKIKIETKELPTTFTSLIKDSPLFPSIIVPNLRPTVNVRTQELENLEKYLQSGDLVSAASSYKFLKAFGSESDAQELLAKYGYKVEEKDGEYVISKIEENNSNSSTETATNKDESSTSENATNNNEHDVVAEETVNEKTEEPPKENLSMNESNNQKQTENIVNATTDNHNNSSNNNKYSNSSNHSQSVVENTSTAVNNQENIQVDTDNVSTDSTTIEDSIKGSPKEETKTNVVSITDDNKTPAPKKSSGLGAAVPIGLGTIATGAAAVAGVRYVKNRHDNQEEYEEDYDDENNNLADNSEQYVDSAQYDDGSSYMDDDYLGPVDNSDISTEDSYVDPGELEEIEDFSNDVVLEDLNSNY